MRNKKVSGNCAICGNESELTFEHIPPQKAFNDQKYYILSSDEWIGRKYDEPIKGKIPYQGGVGVHSLCKICNNKTGRWYGTAYINFCYQGVRIMQLSNQKPTLIYLYHISPLQILKQVVSMFLSINHSYEFYKTDPELCEFVLKKEQKYLNKKYQIYMFYKSGGQPRLAPLTFSLEPSNGRLLTYTEMAFFPFGFVLTIDSPPPHKDLVNITNFKTYNYSHWGDIELQLPILATYIPIAGFYRTKEEIDKAYEESEKRMQSQDLDTLPLKKSSST